MSLPRYPAYKESGFDWIAEIPVHWSVRKFRHSFTESDEKIDSEVIGQMLSVSGYRGIEVKEYDDENRRRTDDELVGYRIVRPGQLVVNTMWLNYTGLGVSEFEGHVSPAYRAYWIGDVLDKKYVHHMMRSGEFVKGYTKFLTGIRPNSLQMSRDDLMEFRLVEPPSDEQKAIATFLDRETAKIDALIAEQETLLALLAEKRQAIISHAVTKGLNPDAPMKDSGIPWLGVVPGHWEVIPIKRLTSSIEQGWSPQCESYPVEDAAEWGVLKVGCVNGGVFSPTENKKLPDELDPINEYALKKNDLLISRANTRELVGSAAVVLEDWPRLLLCDKLYRLRMGEDQCDPSFVAAFLGCPASRSQIEVSATGASSSMLNIGQAAILEMPMPLPPPDEQREILRFIRIELDRVGQLWKESESAIALLKERRSALIAAAVTGQIDVRGAVDARAA